MEKYKDILRYHFLGLSQRQTAETVGVSRNTVTAKLYLTLGHADIILDLNTVDCFCCNLLNRCVYF